MLIVYEDDFKLAAETGEHDALWEAIREVIDMDPETPDGRFLGRFHERGTTTAASGHTLLDNHPASLVAGGANQHAKTRGGEDAQESHKLYDPNRKVELVIYNMERFAKDCVNVFCELSGYAQTKVGTAPTPFDESKDPLVVIEEPAKSGTNGLNATPQGRCASAGGTGPRQGDGFW